MRATILLLALLPFLATAQHCGYCGAGLIAIHAHAEGDPELVSGLRITLLDSAGVPAMHHSDNPYGDFDRNDLRTASWEQRLPWKGRGDRRFPFAGDTYVLVVPVGLLRTGWSVLVQDMDQDAPRFREQVVPLRSYDCHPLCGRSEDEVYEPRSGHPEFTPIDVILRP